MLSHHRMLLPSILAVLISNGATAEEAVLFRRIVPLEVRWGESEFVDGAAVGLVPPPDSKGPGLVVTTEPGTEIQKLPLSASIVCSERSRREPEADGAAVFRWASFSGRDSSPAVSPDGRTVAFT